jgi:serine/threonine protein kinase/tetratricopeptide (TPR) repeat protein
MIPAVGQQFGPFEILGRLGRGGMGVVFRAWDSRLHREVAIKILQSDYAMPGMRERFLVEARAASGLNHPNICTIFDIGERDNDPYLVMELLQGETLKDRILNRTIPTEEIVCIAKEVADALSAAHEKGIVHRDIKPANLFLVDKAKGFSQTKVLDFGLAKISTGRGSRASRALDLTSVGATVGTLAYMSPEQARGEVLDARSDLFSLGVVMYEMATRQIPFPGATSALVFVKLLNEAPEPIREWNEAIPKDLDRVIQKLLAKDRNARFQTAQEVVDALDKLGEKQGGSWLRKAVSSVPLVRAPDPPARARNRDDSEIDRGARQGDRRDSDQALDIRERNQPPRAAEPRGRPSHPSPAGSIPVQGATQEIPQFLRPVARLPKEDVYSSLQAQGRIPAESRSATPAPEQIAGAARHPSFGAVPGARMPRPTPSPTLFPDRDPGVRPPSSGVSEPPSKSRASDASRLAEPGRESALPPAESSGPAGSTTPGSLPASLQSPSGSSASSRPGALSNTSATAPGYSDARELAEVRLPEPRLNDPRGPKRTQPIIPGASDPETLLASEELDGPLERPWLARIVIGTGALALIGLCVLLVQRGRVHPAILTAQDSIILTAIENHTGDKAFDGSIAAALQIALSQSPYLHLRSSEDYRLALRQLGGNDAMSLATARDVAARLSAKAYLYGSISGTGAPYVLHLDLRDTATDNELSAVDATANSREQIASAVDLLSDTMRSNVGEDGDSIARNHTPLAREATTNFEALHQFSLGESLLSAGQPVLALDGYQQAALLDPKFVQAELGLVRIYRLLGAETAAEDAARLALDGAANAGDRTRLLAQFTYELNASYDYTHATAIARQMVAQYPRDATAKAGLSLALRLQGRLPEALDLAQQATAEDTSDADAYVQTELALIALDRYDAAFHVVGQLARMGLESPDGGLTAAFLGGRPDIVGVEAARIKDSRTLLPGLRSYGLYLDNIGQMAQGTALWNQGASLGGDSKPLASASALLLAQGALDRALAGDCVNALGMARSAGALPQGHEALFHAGMAGALCGDLPAAQKSITALEQRYPQSTAVNGYFIPDLKGAIALESGDPAAAVEALQPAHQFDLISLTPFLRGRAHVALRQIEIGIVDYQTVLSHRGLALIVGSNVYPMAQIGVARAFAYSGDTSNSADAYRRFAEMWKNADRNQSLLSEAILKSRY